MPTIKRPMGRSANTTIAANKRGALGVGRTGKRTSASSIYHKNGNDNAYSWKNDPNGIKKK